jgi:peroxiredoxin
MSRKIQNRGVPSFGHFLEYLRLNKFNVGVAHYARVRHVLERVNANFRSDNPESLKDLKSLLRPIFATSEKEQDRFSVLFDDYVEHCREATRARMGWPRAVGDSGPSTAPVRLNEMAGRPGVTGRWLQAARHALDGWRRKVRSRLSRNAIAAIALAFAALAAAICLLALSQPADIEIANPSQLQPLPAATIAPTQPLPAPTPPPDEIEPPAPFYLAVAIVLLLLPLLYALLRRGLRALDPRSYENKRPPFKWPLRAAVPAIRLYDSELFRGATRLLRRRQIDEFFRLDLGATVSATIRSLGYPNFRYKPATRMPEYLALIESASPHDHQARLFDEMVKALRGEGVIVTRYFYRDDPLICCDSRGENYVRLEQLKQRYAGHQLLLFSSGEQLLDPMTGRLTERAAVLFDWHNRAVVTPESGWGWREHVLSEKFIVVPADVQGLLALANRLESPEMIHSVNSPPADPVPRVDEDSQTLDALRRYLGLQTFRWLCSCAVYTELRWELTLLLGSLPSMPEGLVNEDNLLRLSRLPWFRKGSIPEGVRIRLIEELEPSVADQTRKKLVSLLEIDPPPPNTFASDAHGLELALQRWLLCKDKKSLGELRNALQRLPPRHISRSEVLATLLKTVPHKFFGQHLPGMFYQRGIPALGLSALVHIALSLTIVVAAIVALRARSEDVPQWAYTLFIPTRPMLAVPPAPEVSPTSTPLTATPMPPSNNSSDDISGSVNTNTGFNVNRAANANQRPSPQRTSEVGIPLANMNTGTTPSNLSSRNDSIANSNVIDGSSDSNGNRNLSSSSTQLTLSDSVATTEIKMVEGKSVRLADYNDSVIVLILWASWCDPCNVQIESFNNLVKEYSGRPVQFIGLTIEEPSKDAQRVQDFVDSNNINFPLGWADKNVALHLMAGRGNIPQTFIIKNGVIRNKFIGYSPERSVTMTRNAIDEAIAANR